MYDLLKALGANALPAWEQHHVSGGVRPVHRARALRRLLNEDAVAGLPHSQPEWRELEEGEDRDNHYCRDEPYKEYALKNDLDHR